MPNRVPRLLSRLCLGYAVFLAVWWVLRLVFFDTVWWLALLNTVALFLFLPLPVLFGIALARRRWRALYPLMFPAAIFGVLFGAVLLPPGRL